MQMQTDDGIKPYTEEDIEYLRREMVDAQAKYHCARLRNRILKKNGVPALALPTRIQLAMRTIRAYSDKVRAQESAQ